MASFGKCQAGSSAGRVSERHNCTPMLVGPWAGVPWGRGGSMLCRPGWVVRLAFILRGLANLYCQTFSKKAAAAWHARYSSPVALTWPHPALKVPVSWVSNVLVETSLHFAANMPSPCVVRSTLSTKCGPTAWVLKKRTCPACISRCASEPRRQRGEVNTRKGRSRSRRLQANPRGRRTASLPGSSSSSKLAT
jgi:hypothetical protein